MNIDIALNWLDAFGHKKLPKTPEETLQRTIQDLRDRGYILFLGNGEYKLTKKGLNTLDQGIKFFEIIAAGRRHKY